MEGQVGKKAGSLPGAKAGDDPLAPNRSQLAQQLDPP
jgi:hypothetical protein